MLPHRNALADVGKFGFPDVAPEFIAERGVSGSLPPLADDIQRPRETLHLAPDAAAHVDYRYNGLGD